MNNRALFIQNFVSIIVFCTVYCLYLLCTVTLQNQECYRGSQNPWHEPLLSLELQLLLMYCSRYDCTLKFRYSEHLLAFLRSDGCQLSLLSLQFLGFNYNFFKFFAMLCHNCIQQSQLIDWSYLLSYSHCSILVDWLLQVGKI